MGTGRFSSLRLTHLIPKQRLTENTSSNSTRVLRIPRWFWSRSEARPLPNTIKLALRLGYWKTYIDKKVTYGLFTRKSLKVSGINCPISYPTNQVDLLRLAH